MNNPFTPIFDKINHYKAMRVIRVSGKKKKKVVVEYMKANGKIIRRTISPYELKKHRITGKPTVYLTDNKHGPKNILAYNVSGIKKARATNKRFKPQWEIKL